MAYKSTAGQVPGSKVKVLILFGNPEDSDKFDKHFDTTHRELLNSLPEVEQLIVNHIAGVVVGDLPYYLIIEIHFQNEQHMQNSLNSDPGQAMARDYAEFATGGTKILFCHSQAL
jgi:uncharacterized protein (TIGR02118 family)